MADFCALLQSSFGRYARSNFQQAPRLLSLFVTGLRFRQRLGNHTGIYHPLRCGSLFAARGASKSIRAAAKESPRVSWAAVSVALAIFLVLLAWRTYLSRFPYLWQDHKTFAGVTFVEANYLLPALYFVAVALLLAAAIALANAFSKRGLRLLLVGACNPIVSLCYRRLPGSCLRDQLHRQAKRVGT